MFWAIIVVVAVTVVEYTKYAYGSPYRAKEIENQPHKIFVFVTPFQTPFISHFEFYNIAHTLHIRVAHAVHTIIRTRPISAIVECCCCCCCSDACVCVPMCVYIQFTTECQTMCKRYACECDRARKNQYMKWYYFTFSKWNLLSSLAQCVALLFSLRYPHDVVWMVGLRSRAYTACMRVCVFFVCKKHFTLLLLPLPLLLPFFIIIIFRTL